MARFKVKFTGPDVVIRRLIKKDEEKKGILLPEDLEWSRDNGHTLFLDDLDESALHYFRNVDGEFTVTEVEAPKEDATPKAKR